jgi:outer membrane receptor protein involved in Fe transport
MLANAWTSYDLPLPDALGKLQLAGGIRYREHEYTDAGQTRLLPHSTAVDLSAAWVRDHWTLRAGVQNLFDRTNYAYSAGTGSGAIPDQGRTVFVSFVLKAF